MKKMKKWLIGILIATGVAVAAIRCLDFYFPYNNDCNEDYRTTHCFVGPDDEYNWLRTMSKLWGESDRQDLVQLVKEGIEKGKSPDDIWQEVKKTPRGASGTLIVPDND
ncbi:MAG: hypothetical protein LBT46_09515 [Planctomycetaceae bacterium]|jgi:hypothetical protein|nr:hypothetical protein [Planctomycetaceae bacterium]